MFRKINENDRDIFMSLTKEFYMSEAVMHSVPERNRINTWNELMRSEQYAQCFIFEYEGETAGYALLSKTFSQEAGGMVIWIEELYILPQFRSKGLAKEFFDYILSMKNISRVRLEVEPDNERAIKLYKSVGFEVLPYVQYIRESKD